MRVWKWMCGDDGGRSGSNSDVCVWKGRGEV